MANEGLLSRKRLLGGAEETTTGTPASVTTAFGAACYDARMLPDDWYGEGTRSPINTKLGYQASVIGKQLGTLTFRMEMRDGDDGGTSVQALKLLTGCGFALSGSTYSPTSNLAARKTWTFALWEDGRKKVLHGCAGNVVFEVSAGGRWFANFTFRGVMTTAVADSALPTQPSGLNSAPATGVGIGTLTLGGVSLPHVARLSIDLGNEVSEREDVTAPAGVRHFIVTERFPKITIDPEARLVAEYDTWGKLASGALEAFSLVKSFGTRSLTIAAPKTQRLSITEEDRNNRVVDALELGCMSNSGDDELTFNYA